MTPYFLRNLVPKREKVERERPLWEVLKGLTWTQWGLLTSGCSAWVCDATDFFSVLLTIAKLRGEFNRSTHEITTSITLTLLFRPIGAVIFGLLSDRFGRKWPLVANLLLISVLSLATGFVQTFQQFLAVRSLSSIGMGGIWGLASATALENIPVEVRGLASGVLQQGYAIGYLSATSIDVGFASHTTWRALFWAASGVSASTAVFRSLLPESELFLRARREREAELNGDRPSQSKTRIFFHEIRQMFKHHWQRCIYVVMLMSGFIFLSHGTQDLYPTFLQESKGLTASNAGLAKIIGNCGALAGSTFFGGLSQYIGRRLAIIISVLLIGMFIPLWIIPNTFSKLSAGAFWVQFCVQGALGVVAIFLSEISPPAFRSTFAGVAYQMGIMVASSSAQIEATGGEHIRTTIQGPNGPENVPNYALIQGIFVGSVAVYVIVLTLIGPENHGSHFERGKTAFQVGASKEVAGFIPDETEEVRDVEKLSVGSGGGKEREDIQYVENKTPAKDGSA